MSTFVLMGIIFGCITLVVIANAIPFVAAMVVLGLGILGPIVWFASNHAEKSEEEAAATREHDPLAVLKDRYARGELSEEEFERRVTTLLAVDERPGDEQDGELETA